MARGKPRSPRSPEESLEAPVRIFPRGPKGWLAADFRQWGRGRVTLRDPDAPGWPAAGERTHDREVALRWALRYIDLFREEVRRQQLKLGAKPRQLGEACEAYLAHRQDVERRPVNTVQNDRAALNHVRYHAAQDGPTGRKGDDLRTDRIGTEFLQRLFDEMLREGYEPGSVHGYRRGISGFLRYLGHGEDNAAQRCKLPRATRTKPDPWSTDQLADIRAAADRCDRKFHDFTFHRRAIELALHSGGRRNELFALEGRRVRREDDTIRFTHQVEKVRRRLVPLKGKDERVALLLPDWEEHVPLSVTGLLLPAPDGGLVQPDFYADIIVRIYVEAGVYRAKAGWHTLRHTYARDFLLLGGRLEELQKSLGHKSITTTQQYYDQFVSDLAAAAARQRIYRDAPVRLAR